MMVLLPLYITMMILFSTPQKFPPTCKNVLSTNITLALYMIMTVLLPLYITMVILVSTPQKVSADM